MKSITRVLDVHLLPVDGMPENRIFALESPFLSLFLYTYILFFYISLYFFVTRVLRRMILCWNWRIRNSKFDNFHSEMICDFLEALLFFKFDKTMKFIVFQRNNTRKILTHQEIIQFNFHFILF